MFFCGLNSSKMWPYVFSVNSWSAPDYFRFERSTENWKFKAGSSSGFKYVNPSYPRPPLMVYSLKKLLPFCINCSSKPSVLSSLLMKVMGGLMFLRRSSSKLMSPKNLCFFISSAPDLLPNLSFGFILKRSLSKERAYSDKCWGIGTGRLVIFFIISCLFFE